MSDLLRTISEQMGVVAKGFGESRKVERMNAIAKTMSVAVLVALGLALGVHAAEPAAPTDLDKLVGQQVDLSPWAYAWRANREVQEQPEAYFIPRRLKRLDEVYRTIASRPTETDQDKKRVAEYKGMDLLPAPKGRLLSALLWLAPVPAQRIEVRWPEGSVVPPSDAIEVRIYPSKVGWFGVVRDEVLPAPAVSADGNTLTYLNQQAEGPTKGKAIFEGTDMVALFLDPAKAPAGAKYGCPTIHLFPPNRKWNTLDVEIEWGFQPGAEQTVFDGRIEAYGGYVKSVKPLPEDKGTEMTGADAWKSAPTGGARRGIVVSLLHPYRFGNAWRISPLDTRITLWTRGGNLTFLPDDVHSGPVLVPGPGVFVAKAGGKTTARQFAAELAAKNLKTIPQMTREHPEAASWEEVMRKVKLAHCPPGTVIPPLVPFEEPPATAMQVSLSDERWTDAWRRASWDLKRGGGGYGYLALEAAISIYPTDLSGNHETVARRLDYWLKAPGVKADGDFVDGDGSFEYATTMQYDIGWYHDGTHPQTGRILSAMAEHYLLTGDKQWFQKNRARMQAAADWILRQRAKHLQDIPNRQALDVAGLQPPQVLGDIGLGKCCWRWYLVHDAFSLQGLRRFADALEEFDPGAARRYRVEADAYAKDLLRAVEREMAIAPVRKILDGSYRRYIPASPYARGSMVREIFGTYPLVDIAMGALPLADAFGVLGAADPRIGEHLDVIEELLAHGNKKNDPSTTQERFWTGFANDVVKYMFVDKIHLRRDDVPCFLRLWMNNYAAWVTVEGGFPEPDSLKRYAGDPAGKPKSDLGSTGWFVESFRNLLVMEDGQSLWLAKATPRAWLEQGKKISVKNAPTYFGPVAYEIVSDADKGQISATIEMPARKSPNEVVLRFRHPKSAPIKAVTVNGKAWTEFNKDKETITLKSLTGTVAVTARY
ncbi:hypothetical protein [Lignipirellula cremea]|uniref:Uncharacterized protein n=1 Tax=Lignipirellula cremea TaxID=2528010 RepID=A0A518DXH5_9BACT|nr:hypothetical protein [Lignipirellula cremea]QDU96541.1 hypothetical protein Pla8534_43620 [Lignipirellula cremea]